MLPKQSNVRAFGSEQPYMQDPLKASHCCFLHLVGHRLAHPWEYLFLSQPKENKRQKSSPMQY